jgi:hypothetical protein
MSFTGSFFRRPQRMLFIGSGVGGLLGKSRSQSDAFFPTLCEVAPGLAQVSWNFPRKQSINCDIKDPLITDSTILDLFREFLGLH